MVKADICNQIAFEKPDFFNFNFRIQNPGDISDSEYGIKLVGIHHSSTLTQKRSGMKH